ncbi:MAG: protein-L-isoaspartate O-methyltransferase family protein [Alphaproteobacteria bacterium]
MVESQIRTNKVTDPAVIGAFSELPRERFVPEGLRGVAYVDEDIELTHGRFLMEPMILARLVQIAAPKAEDIALDVGCGSGYASAVLARLCSAVVALESDRGLIARANALFDEMQINNVVVVEGALTVGYPRQAPYNVILLNGAVERIPQPLFDQLADGGRLVTVHMDGGVGRGTLYLKSAGVISHRPIFDAATPVLPGFSAEPHFVF